MIAAPASVLRDYELIDLSDDALAQPTLDPEPSRLAAETDEAFAARTAAWAKECARIAKEWREVYDRCCETGDWSPLLLPGKDPTIFRLRQVGASAWAAFYRVVRSMAQQEIEILAFRLAVVAIDGLNLGVTVTRAPFVGDDGRREPSFGDVLSTAVIDAIASAPGGRAVIAHVSGIALSKNGAPLGK